MRYAVDAVAATRIKSSKISPTFEKMNLERLKQCEETTNSAKRTVEESRRLTQRARELIDSLRKDRTKAG